jgi:hypothetical protein
LIFGEFKFIYGKIDDDTIYNYYITTFLSKNFDMLEQTIYSIEGSRPLSKEQRQNQDAFCVCKNNVGTDICIVADGHGSKSEFFSEKVVEIVEKLDLTFQMELSDFRKIILDAMKPLVEENVHNGTTLLVVIFNEEHTKAKVFNLGDSYAIFNIPKDFEGNAKKLIVNYNEEYKYEGSIKSMSGGSRTEINQRMKTIGCEKIGLYGKTARYELAGKQFCLNTFGVERFAGICSGNAICNFMNEIAWCGEVDLLPNMKHVIGSDGMPIHEPEFWSAVNSGNVVEWIKRNLHRDDLTCIVFQ